MAVIMLWGRSDSNAKLPAGRVTWQAVAYRGSNDAKCQFVRRDDPHAAVAGGDEDDFGAAADDADLGGDGAGLEHQHREASRRLSASAKHGSR